MISSDRTALATAAETLVEAWHEPDTVLAAFDDLCNRASELDATSRQLRPLAAVLASQLREGIAGGWSVLREVATALAGEPVEPQLRAWFGPDATLETITPTDRLRAARAILTKSLPTGEVVVWLVYDRARVPWRVTAGSITFYQGEWMVPNAHSDSGQEFDGRDELRALLDKVWWSEDLLTAVSKVESHIVLVRVALGQREAVGAVGEAIRQVEALLSIAVEAGGVSWQSVGSTAILLDGELVSSSQGRAAGREQTSEQGDSYGIGVTSEALQHTAEQLDEALARQAMPDFLVEALLALREAAMADHRDVLFYGQRAVTPRVATALEDHALEAIASFASMSTEELAGALGARHDGYEIEQYLLRAFMAPLDETWRSSDHTERRDLERVVSQFKSGRRIVSIPEVVRQRARVEALEMSPVARADLAEAFLAVVDPRAEDELRRIVGEEVALLRARHRRIRNAVAHGNPLTEAALASTRDIGTRIAHDALQVALGAFAHDTTVSAILQKGEDRRAREAAGAANGRSYVDRRESHTDESAM